MYAISISVIKVVNIPKTTVFNVDIMKVVVKLIFFIKKKEKKKP